MVSAETLFSIGLIVVVIGILTLVGMAIYIATNRIGGDFPCSTNQNCSPSQICSDGHCLEVTCSTSTQCPNGICVDGYCWNSVCQTGNDCDSGSACVNGYCIAVGMACESNSNCPAGIECRNGICAQCQVDTDCGIGEGCFTGGCRYPYPGETGTGMLMFPSDSSNRGNVTAPPGYFCPQSNCGLTGIGGPIGCTGSSSCPSSCSFCIDNVCRCTAGELYEPCTQNRDCLSGVCGSSIYGQVCIPVGGQCAFNYSLTGGTGFCPSSLEPYCVDGRCSSNSLGALCGSDRDSSNLCSTGGYFCVNGRCRDSVGTLNQQCSGNACLTVDTTNFICGPKENQNSELQRRCRSV